MLGIHSMFVTCWLTVFVDPVRQDLGAATEHLRRAMNWARAVGRANVVREAKRMLEMLQEAGIPAMDVIVAATKNSAMVCGQGEELGTLETGKLADLLVLEGDPLTDLVGAVQRVALVLGQIEPALGKRDAAENGDQPCQEGGK